jgi:hypothetical protein
LPDATGHEHYRPFGRPSPCPLPVCAVLQTVSSRASTASRSPTAVGVWSIPQGFATRSVFRTYRNNRSSPVNSGPVPNSPFRGKRVFVKLKPRNLRSHGRATRALLLASLLRASFRLRLTAPPLRFAITSRPSRCEQDLHLLAAGHARHTTKRPDPGFLESGLAFAGSQGFVLANPAEKIPIIRLFDESDETSQNPVSLRSRTPDREDRDGEPYLLPKQVVLSFSLERR